MQQISGKPQQVAVVVKMFFEAMYEYILVKVKLLLEQQALIQCKRLA
ncbi:MAG: hypothetical protein IPG70_08595 [Moraxellaceae bacterium]|nr:hypothetical protein [Moraxellaceae bacterium]